MRTRIQTKSKCRVSCWKIGSKFQCLNVVLFPFLGGGRDLATAATFSKAPPVKVETQTSAAASSSTSKVGTSGIKFPMKQQQQQPTIIYPKVTTKSTTGFDKHKTTTLGGVTYGTLLYVSCRSFSLCLCLCRAIQTKLHKFVDSPLEIGRYFVCSCSMEV
jgi:hypothetical protein